MYKNLTEKGRNLITYLKEGRTDNPEFERTLIDLKDIIEDKNPYTTTRDAVAQFLLEALGD